MSLFMRDVISTTSSVRTGGRVASVAAGAGPGVCQASSSPPPCVPANTPALAQAAADAIQRAGAAMPKDQIDYLLVYKANAAGYPLPAGNTGAACSVSCVRFVWDEGLSKFRYSSGTWISSTINACVNNPGRDTVGVLIVARHPWVSGVFGSGASITERAVMNFEPLPSDQCMPGTHL